MIHVSAILSCAKDWINFHHIKERAKRYYGWILFVFIFFSPLPTSASSYTPVYIEDSHAGTYYFFVENLNLEQDYQLLLFDKHSDATEVFDSDAIREKAAASKENYKLDSLFVLWRNRGIIQCFNWIEPLMPKPLTRVTWVAGEKLTPKELKERKNVVKEQINCHEEAFSRNSGDLSARFGVLDFTSLRKLKKSKLPVTVSIDLDYFSGLDEAEQSRELNEVLDYTFSLGHLQAISVAISYPYLQSKQEADHLLYNLFRYLNQVKNLNIRYEPFRDNGMDRSELARTYYKKQLPIPKYEVTNASISLKNLWRKIKITVTYKNEEWQSLLSDWRNRSNCNPCITLYKNQQKISTAHFNYFTINDEMILRVEGLETLSTLEISWKVLYPRDQSINLTERNYGFADNATKWIYFVEKYIPNQGIELKGDTLRNLFDPKTGFGTVRVFAEIKDNEDIYRSDIVCLSRYKDSSYLGKLTEIFNLPYILGSCLIKDNNWIGADAKYGADCSNFIIYGKRRLGVNIPYVNPSQLKSYLSELDIVDRFINGEAHGKNGKVYLDDNMINEGLLLHFGGHVVAVYQDNEPKNVLDYNDMVVHQLEGYPEIIPLKNLRQINNPFEVMKFK